MREFALGNEKEALKLREELRKRFEGKIKCAGCDNKDWQQFLFVTLGGVVMGGCKLCGHPNKFEDAPVTVLPQAFAYTAVVTDKGYSVGRADRGIAGYTPQPQYGSFGTYDAASEKAEELNEELGLTKKEAFQIVASTMNFKKL